MASVSGNESNRFENYVNLMHKTMDTSVDPATDFIGYARGNFRKEDFDVTKGDYLPILNGDCYNSVILNETITYPSLRKARDYRKSHVKEFKILLQNKRLHEFCGTFPAFDDNWKSENFDWIKASGILSAMHFRLTLSYGIRCTEGEKSVVLSIIGPDEAPIIDAKEILPEMGITDDDKILDIINDVELINKKFDEITPKDGYPNFQKLKKTYKELKEEKFDYQKFLEPAFREPLADNDIVYLNNLEPGYFDKFLGMFDEVGPKVMANYLTYKVGCQLNNDYYSSSVTLYHFTPAILAAGFSTFWSEEVIQKRKEVFEIFSESLKQIEGNFRKGLSRELEYFRPHDQKVKEFIDIHYNQDQIEKEYEDLEIDPEDFFQNFFNIRKHGTTPSTEKYILFQDKESLQRQAIQLLDFLIHHHNRPMFFFFAGWEVRMWIDIIRDNAFDQCSEEYKSLEKCISEQIQRYNLPTASINNEFWRNHYIAVIAALKLSYLDYKTWLRQNELAAKKEEEILEKLNLTCTQAFFISFVQHRCWDQDIMLNALILSLYNSEEFSKEFSCKPDSVMNPKEKCIISWNKI